MAQRIDWDSQLGRRLRLRELHVLMTVARLGSMARAAKELSVSQPAVSEAIADLEHALGVDLLDRTPQGVVATPYGVALIRRSEAAFDELRQGIREIELLSGAAGGEICIGCPESIAAAFLQPIVASFTQAHPQVVIDVETVNTQTFLPMLRKRSFDLVLARGGRPLDEPHMVEDLQIEMLFDDSLVIAVGREHPLAAKQAPELRDLAKEPWILSQKDRWNYQIIAEAFQRNGMSLPQVRMTTISVHLRAELAATGRFVTTFPRSVLLLHGERLQLKVLPIDLPSRSWPIMAVTLKHRTLSPLVHHFMEHSREVARKLSPRG